MKRYEIYKNIRKKALIWGLPISLFTLMIISVVGSLLVIIFSFSFVAIIGAFIFNITLYVAFIKFRRTPQLLQFTTLFPRIISNKKSSLLDYEED